MLKANSLLPRTQAEVYAYSESVFVSVHTNCSFYCNYKI